MITDIIQFSGDTFTCSECREKFPPGVLVNVFRWDDRMLLYCMKCLASLVECEDTVWESTPKKDPRMKE
jgi:hypothetical protein